MIHLSFWSCSSCQFLGSKLFIFSFWSSELSRLSRREAPSKSLQGFTLCFQLLFLSIILLLPDFFQLSFHLIILLLPKFFMESLCGGSLRILLILQLFFKIFLFNLRSAKLYSKINMVLNTCFVSRRSSILHLASQRQFFLPYLLRWCYVILDNRLHVS